MFAKSLTLFALAASVAAQSANNSSTATGTGSAVSPSASAILGALSPCVLACLVPAAQLNDCTFTDVPCVCASAQFQLDAATCLNEHCSSSDLAAAVALQTSQCTAAGIQPNSTATTPNSIPFNLPGSSTAASTPTGSSTGASVTPTTPATSIATTGAPVPSPTGNSASLTTASGVVALFAAVAGVLAL